MSETVYVVSNGKNGSKRKMHTNEHCHQLQKTNNVFEKEKHLVESHFDYCKHCTGNRDQGHASQEIRNALINGNPEDFGLSPLGER